MPLGDRAADWLDVRPRYAAAPDDGWLFITQLQEVHRRTHPARAHRTAADHERLLSSLAADLAPLADEADLP